MADTDWNAFSDVTSLLDTDTLLATRGGAGINFLAALLLFRSGGTVSGNLNVGGILTALAQGAEGGEIHLEKAPGSTLAGDIIVDTANQHVRIFEGAGTNRGVVIDLSACAAGAGSQIATKDNAPGAAPIYFSRAWANVSGRSTNGACVVNGSGNIGSITRTSLGVYQIVFNTPMPHANYSVSGSIRYSSFFSPFTVQNSAKTADGFFVVTAYIGPGGTGMVSSDPADFDFCVVC